MPNELFLDIKRLAEYETDLEQTLRELFDFFAERPDSPLLGLMSPTARTRGKISHVTFNAAVKPLIAIFQNRDIDEIYGALRAYLSSMIAAAAAEKMAFDVTHPVVFRAVTLLFSDVAQRVKDRFGPEYSEKHFFEVIEPMFSRLKSTTFKNPGNSSKELYAALRRALKE